jgi:hypothetical protein
VLKPGLLPQPDRFERLSSLSEYPNASDLPLLDRAHQRAPRNHFDPLTPPTAGGVRVQDLGARLREAVGLELDILKRRQNSSQKASSSP